MFLSPPPHRNHRSSTPQLDLKSAASALPEWHQRGGSRLSPRIQEWVQVWTKKDTHRQHESQSEWMKEWISGVLFPETTNAHKPTDTYSSLWSNLQYQITRASDLNWCCLKGCTNAETYIEEYTHTLRDTNTCTLTYTHKHTCMFSLVLYMHRSPRVRRMSVENGIYSGVSVMHLSMYAPVRAWLCFSVLCSCFRLESLLDQWTCPLSVSVWESIKVCVCVGECTHLWLNGLYSLFLALCVNMPSLGMKTWRNGFYYLKSLIPVWYFNLYSVPSWTAPEIVLR